MESALPLHRHCWMPNRTPVASVVIAHGYGEHGARYSPLAEGLNREGVAVHACDQRGHGRSPGARGVIRCFDNVVEDFAGLVASVRGEAGANPLFLLGHSLGALVVGHYVLKHRPHVRGLIFSSGVLKVGDDVSPLLQRLSWFLNVVAPWLPVLPIRPELTSRLPESVARYAADPLNFHGRMSARTGYQILSATRRLQEQASTIDLPVLVLHGTADRLTDPEGSRKFYDGVCSADKTLLPYDGAYHEMMHDANADEFVADIVRWVAARIA